LDAEHPASDAPIYEPLRKKIRSETFSYGNTQYSLFFALPSELRHVIFNLLPLRDVVHAQLVCSSWLAECWNCRTTLDFVSDVIFQGVTDKYMDYLLAKCSKPKWIELYLTGKEILSISCFNILNRE